MRTSRGKTRRTEARDRHAAKSERGVQGWAPFSRADAAKEGLPVGYGLRRATEIAGATEPRDVTFTNHAADQRR